MGNSDLFLLLCGHVLHDLLKELEEQGCRVIVYADNVALLEKREGLSSLGLILRAEKEPVFVLTSDCNKILRYQTNLDI